MASINPATYPPNHIPTHGWRILHRFQIFKWNWNALISSSVIEFLLILGVPLGWRMGGWVGMGMGVWGRCHMHAHTHMHAHMHMHVKHDKHAKHGCLHVGGHLQFLYMYTCVYMNAHAYAWMWGHPPCLQMPPDTPLPTCPLPRATGSPKTKIQ